MKPLDKQPRFVIRQHHNTIELWLKETTSAPEILLYANTDPSKIERYLKKLRRAPVSIHPSNKTTSLYIQQLSSTTLKTTLDKEP